MEKTTNPLKSKSKKRLLALDGLRGIAALTVVFYHYFHRYNGLYGHEDLYTGWTARGNKGVELFFIISGFVIFWSLKNAKNAIDFVVFRFARLYPMYWAALIATFVTVSYFGLPGRRVSEDHFWGNFWMFHYFMDYKDVDGVYWTLRWELVFYFWMLVIYAAGLLNWIEYFLIACITVTLLSSQGVLKFEDMTQHFFLLKYISFFAMGICFYKIFSKEYNFLTVFTLFYALAVTPWIFGWINFYIYVGITIIVFLAIKDKLKILESTVLVFFGSISYALYLMHQNIGYVLIRKGYEYELPPLLSIALTLGIMILAAYMAHRLIEQPFSKGIRWMYKSIVRAINRINFSSLK